MTAAVIAVLIAGILYVTAKPQLSPEVLAYEPDVGKYADSYGIQQYEYVLLAIMQVESAGRGEDVMQSSESAGLDVNQLSADESIEQGCKYFRALLDIARTEGCDLESVIQAYNFGPGYLYYVAENGGEHSYDLAVSYARDQSDGKRTPYMNPTAFFCNGGWRYTFGNMFYEILVSQYL